jgi:hypothetical protein
MSAVHILEMQVGRIVQMAYGGNMKKDSDKGRNVKDKKER